MRIAVPTNDGTTLSPHFGRSAGFLVFEITDGRIESREMRTNQQPHEHAQGACGGHTGGGEAHNHGSILAALAGCDVVICAEMGARAAEALRSGGITKVVFTEPGPAEETVTAFVAGKLIAADQSFCQCSH